MELQRDRKDLSVWPYTEVATGDDVPPFGPVSPVTDSRPVAYWRCKLDTHHGAVTWFTDAEHKNEYEPRLPITGEYHA